MEGEDDGGCWKLLEKGRALRPASAVSDQDRKSECAVLLGSIAENSRADVVLYVYVPSVATPPRPSTATRSFFLLHFLSL